MIENGYWINELSFLTIDWPNAADEETMTRGLLRYFIG